MTNGHKHRSHYGDQNVISFIHFIIYTQVIAILGSHYDCCLITNYQMILQWRHLVAIIKPSFGDYTVTPSWYLLCDKSSSGTTMKSSGDLSQRNARVDFTVQSPNVSHMRVTTRLHRDTIWCLNTIQQS